MSQGGPPPGEPAPIIGRDDELRHLHDFVDRLRIHGEALLLSGEAGVGKTVLLEAAAQYARAQGYRVVHAAGAEFEADVSFAALHLALQPLLGDLEVHSRDLAAPLDLPAARDVTGSGAGVGRPFLPRPARGTTCFEHQVPARAKGRDERRSRQPPRVVPPSAGRSRRSAGCLLISVRNGEGQLRQIRRSSREELVVIDLPGFRVVCRARVELHQA